MAPAADAAPDSLSLPIRSFPAAEPASVPTSLRAPAATLYDPASPAPVVLAPNLRALSGYNGQLEEATTACWENHHEELHRHVLMCGHQVSTPTIRECGRDWKTSSIAESKPNGPAILCTNSFCAGRRAPANPFMPKKKQVIRKNLARAYKPALTDGLFVTQKRGFEAEVTDLDGKEDYPEAEIKASTNKRMRIALPGERDDSTVRPSSQALATVSADDKGTMSINEDLAHDSPLATL